MKSPISAPNDAPTSLLPWQQATELQDDLLTVCNDLDRLHTLLAGACAELSQGFHGAHALLAQGSAEGAGSAWREQVAQTLARAVTALQFEDMATQLIALTRRRLRHRADTLAVAAFGVSVSVSVSVGVDADADAVIEPAALRPNPVTQDEIDPGSIELF